MEIFIQLLIAVGTIGAVIVALFGEKLKFHLTPSKLKIVDHNLRGDVTTLTDPQGNKVDDSIFYHLKVVNEKPWQIATNTRVLLIAYQKRLNNGDFKEFSVPGETSFIWTPAELSPRWLNISEDHIFDFGRIDKNGDRFLPRLSIIFNNFEGFVKKGEVIRYKLKIKSDNFSSKEIYTYEVSWDGKWDDNLDKMEEHLVIKKIT